MSQTNKRARIAEEERPPLAELESGSQKRRKVVGSKGIEPVLDTQFLKLMKSLHQQGTEQINETLFQFYGQLDKNDPNFDEHLALVVADALRNQDVVDGLYKSVPGGIVISMGNNDTNQLGLETSEDSDKKLEYPPTVVTNLGRRGIKAVAAGGLYTAVLTNDGKVFTFGANDDGALGRVTSSTLEELTPTEIDEDLVDEQDKGKFVSVKAGDGHISLLSINGTVYKAGMFKDLDSGLYRDIPEGTDHKECYKKGNFKPIKVAGLKQPVKAIATGDNIAAAILKDDSLVTWGMGHCGELARSANMTTPTIEDGRKTYDLGKGFFSDLSTGKVDTELVATKFLTPQPVLWADGFGKKQVLDVACGQSHILVCARIPGVFDTRVYSSGLNQYGQLGLGDSGPTTNRHELTLVPTLKDANIAKVAAGGCFSMAMDIFGNVIFGWGRADYGQVGDGTEKDPGAYEATPKQISFPDLEPGVVLRFTQIDAASTTASAITDRGEIYTWGFCESGATGHPGSLIDFTRPMKLENLPDSAQTEYNVVAASGGGQHTVLVAQGFSKSD